MREDITEYELELLGVLQEECAEVIQIISKIRRFGLNDWHPDDPEQVSNKTKLIDEVGDMVGVIELLRIAGMFEVKELESAANKKVIKLKKFMKSTSEA